MKKFKTFGKGKFETMYLKKFEHIKKRKIGGKK